MLGEGKVAKRGELGSLKGISNSSNNSSDALRDEGETQGMMGQPWAGPHLHCHCLDAHISLALYLNLDVSSGS